MKTLNKIITVSIALLFSVAILFSCSKEEVLPTNSDQLTTEGVSASSLNKSLRGGGSGSCPNNLTMANPCKFYNGNGHLSNYESTIESILNTCSPEPLGPGCQWFFQNRTGTKQFVYQYLDPCLGAKAYNTLIQNIVNDARTYRYNNNSNYLITNYDVLVYFSGPGAWKVKVTVDYRRAICKANTPRK